MIMETVSATKLRKNLFEYLNRITRGETFVIERHNQPVAKLSAVDEIDWRDKRRTTLTINVSEKELIQPLEDWDEYA